MTFIEPGGVLSLYSIVGAQSGSCLHSAWNLHIGREFLIMDVSL